MTTPEGALISRILARHGARPDLKLWRNEVGVFHTGQIEKTLGAGRVILRGHGRVTAGLAKHSADLIGIQHGSGRFISIEVKASTTPTTDGQHAWQAMVLDMGGIAAIVSSVDEVDYLLGEPPK